MDSGTLLHRRQLLAGVTAGSASLLALPNPALAQCKHPMGLPGDCRELVKPAASTITRKNVQDLSAGELLLLRKGVETMKSRPVQDNTSWRFQANIHGFVLADNPINSPLWCQCKHTSDGLLEGKQFLAW